MNARFSRIFIITLIASVGLIIVSLFLGLSITGSVLAGLFPWSFFLLLYSPYLLLFSLIFIRPSLDRLSEILNFSMPFDPTRIITVAQAFGLLTVFLGILYLAPRIQKVLNVPLFYPFLVLLLWGTGTLLYSVSFSQTLYEILRLFSILFIFLLSYFVINTKERFFKLLLISSLSAIIPIATAMYQFIFNIGYVDDAFAVPRIYGTFAHPNIFALYLVVVLAALLLMFFTYTKERAKNISLVAFFTVTAILIMTYARAAWATFFLFLGLIASVKYFKILPALLLIPIVLFLALPSIQGRITEGLNLGPSSSLAWRITIWNDTIHKTIADQNTLLGYGLGTFEIIAESVRGIRFVVNAPHNEFVRSFVEGGVVGLAVFLFFSFAPIFILYKNWKASKTPVEHDTFLILLCLTISLLLLSATDHVLRSTMVQWILWAMIGGALSVYGRTAEEK